MSSIDAIESLTAEPGEMGTMVLIPLVVSTI